MSFGLITHWQSDFLIQVYGGTGLGSNQAREIAQPVVHLSFW